MVYLLSGLVVVGLILLAIVLHRLLRSLRRMRHAQSRLSRTVRDRGGMLRARLAAVEVAVQERNNRPTTQVPHDHQDENGSVINVQPRNR
ncbi:bacteriophage holin [Actinoalloteichus hymeniacidonis]|uniref:Uncharacterized protein n=1 Tax=Actinoalloteichus hymeniacidonis TaxID=340345 RepID=A0AAC9HQ00_9PSEU|nr:bacteriophage holin [Actinoalloteichus hymeniacidonis]AOS63234.1 hypothetical protein TL08_12100 [Actinoalloteichus hymeniacidonis]MBB5908727.1 hypothetical protein [Actinoalloteichus hymeniacidonis]